MKINKIKLNRKKSYRSSQKPEKAHKKTNKANQKIDIVHEKTNRSHDKTDKDDNKTYRTYKKPEDSWIKIVERGACGLGISLNHRQLDSIYFHGSELMKWNNKFNITSITDPFETAVKHFIDCLALVPYIPDNAKLLDIGSGGGFPGLPLKVASPSLDITMMDASRKKISFVNYIIRSLAMTGINAVNARCEVFAEKEDFKHKFDCVVSRAFTSLDRFIALALPFLSKNGIILAMKGPDPEKETQSLYMKNSSHQGDSSCFVMRQSVQKKIGLMAVKDKQLCLKVYSYTLPMGKYRRSIIKISQPV